MKKLVFLACIITAFFYYTAIVMDHKEEISNLQLENIEALANNIEDEFSNGVGAFYKIVQFQCPDPYAYKKKTICEKGGNEYCMPSDC